MKVHKFKNDPKVLLEQGKLLEKETSNPKFARRVSLVNILLEGKMGTKELARVSGVSVRSLQGWLKAADEKGWDSLRDAHIPGRAPLLAPEQVEEIRGVVLNDPHEKGYDVWNGVTLADYIRKTYHVHYSVSNAQRLMHRMGLVLRRPNAVSSPCPDDAEATEPVETADSGEK